MLAIYARLSQDKGDNLSSIENQIHFGKEYAKKLNLSYKIYQDVGVSGTLPIEKRPELFRLIEDIEAKEITNVFAYDQSRIERDHIVWNSLWLLFQKNDTKLYFHSGGEFNFDSPDNFLASNVLSVFNSFFVKLTKQKVVNALQKNVESGKVHASPPFGYTKDSNKNLIINEKESETVKRIYQMSLEGKGTDKIAEILNLEGVLTAYSKLEKGGVYKIRDRYSNVVTEKKKSDAKWRGRTVQGIIKNTIYKGQRFWKGNYYKVPAVFEDVYWQKVNENLQKNRNNTGKKVEHKYLLKGIIKCSCGRNMYGRSRVDKRDHTYICSSRRIKGENCGNRAINIDKIENIIWEHFFIKDELLKLLNEASNSGNSILENLLVERELLEKKLENNEKGKQSLIRSVMNDVLTNDEVKPEIEKIRNENSKIKLQISEIDLRTSNLKDFESLIIETKEDFKKYSLETDFEIKMNLVHKYIDKIIVAYNETPEFLNCYSLEIGFKNEIVKEKYIFRVKNGYLFSFRDRAIRKLVGSEIQYIVSFEDMNEQSLHTQNGILLKPHFDHGHGLEFIKNTFIPYGEIRSWTLEKVIEFYDLNPHWLCNDSGLNIYVLDKQASLYNLFVEKYKGYKNKGAEEWFTSVFEGHLNAVNSRFDKK
ncbi:recombinase family protein [Chryseobacterium sp. ERMR1:04]|uniref:recombinase family protein n=1 Tax=Chryseobacterium sp. ERMR1:04 TaxID=1705393 RepID=UPI0006C8BF4E|nr:recombinase family protein [Chryseobacterium sp. ERMR1:04]KPH11697.1 serine recombinase [Chryseobacterium sp. ERMR1:04]